MCPAACIGSSTCCVRSAAFKMSKHFMSLFDSLSMCKLKSPAINMFNISIATVSIKSANSTRNLEVVKPFLGLVEGDRRQGDKLIFVFELSRHEARLVDDGNTTASVVRSQDMFQFVASRYDTTSRDGVVIHISVMASMSVSVSLMRSYIMVAFPACFMSHTDLAFSKQKDTWHTDGVSCSLSSRIRFCM